MISPVITPIQPHIPFAAEGRSAVAVPDWAEADADTVRPEASAPVRDAPTFEDQGTCAAANAAESESTAAVALPDPFDDAEALQALEKRITTLSARIHAATHRLLTLIAEFDRRQGWKLGGHRSCAHWLAYRTGIDLGTAREKVRTARALVGLPEVSASMSRGELSFSKVRALTRRATADNEGELLEIARSRSTAELERVVRAYPQGSRADEAVLERERYERRTLSVFPDYDGMYVVRGRLPAEVGALFMRAVEAASDALYREQGRRQKGRGRPKGEGTAVSAEEDTRAEAARRRADALGLLAERALAAGFGGGCGSAAEDRGSDGEGAGEALEEAATGGMAPPGTTAGTSPPLNGSRAERYQVMLHVEAGTLEAPGEAEAEGGRSELADGTRVSPETSRRLACDCGLVKVVHSSDGAILDVGRRTRTIPSALRRALEVRDRGCRFPGCESRFTEGHHAVHWADGGETSQANTLLLCRHHHRLVHEGGWTVRLKEKGRAVFVDPRGGIHGGARDSATGTG
ncbi:MAG: DUF222 domain-containing protein [Gemmatimonadota bacterium]